MALHYVILFHDGVDPPHFDLMFEPAPGDKLATWRSPAWPLTQPTILIRLGDHRRDYLTYEGLLSRNRGAVRRIDSGTCTIDRAPDDSFWTIRFPNPQTPPLHLKRNAGDEWVAMFECH